MCAQVGAKFSADFTARLARLTILPFSGGLESSVTMKANGPEAP
jgi:hypothetical protein